jgi:hypothetical protein
MKLPQLHASQGYKQQVYAKSNTHLIGFSGVAPEGILDTIGGVFSGAVSKIPCILANAGPGALGCLYCGPNPACLALCAGPTLVSSILNCLNS